MALKKFKYSDKIEAGCDEAGRGCLAGPVVAAAVILPKNFSCKELDDSKKLSEKQRYALREIILKKALAYSIQEVSHQEIDEINILNASFLAMHRALDDLKTKPNLILVDGNRFNPYPNIPHECIIKGDGIYQSIAAASILAKTYRDDLMLNLHQQYPQYSWNKNMGYPTLAHRDAIRKFGITPFHRKSFRLLPFPEQLLIDF